MNNQIWAESEVGQGTTFFFTIQTRPSHENKSEVTDCNAGLLSGKRLLVVDDNATSRMILGIQAQQWGMLTRICDSSRNALQVLEQGELFDIAILDMQMPDLNGYALAHLIKEKTSTANLPMILLSSTRLQSAAAEDVDSLFIAYFNKPIKQSKLYNKIVDALFPAVNSVKSPETEPYLSNQNTLLSQEYPLSILLVEDNLINQKIALLLLEKLGYRADYVANGQEVLDILEKCFYDVILMDVQMPEMDGITATQHLCELYYPPHRPRIIAMTANTMDGDRELCLEAGMDDYITRGYASK